MTDYGHFASLEIGAAMPDEWPLCPLADGRLAGQGEWQYYAFSIAPCSGSPGHEPHTLTREVLPLTARSSTGPHLLPRAVEVP